MRLLITFIIGFLLFFGILFVMEEEDAKEEEQNEEEEPIVYEEEVELDKEESVDGEAISDDSSGIHRWIGKEEADLVEQFGEPTRKDLTPYGYEWYIYKDSDIYFQFGVSENRVVTVFTNDRNAETAPVNIDDTYEAVNHHFSFNETVSLNGPYSSYQFELEQSDLQMRPLAQLGEVWVQFYFDIVEGTLSSIRYLDQKTLLLQRPYSVVYRGDLLEANAISDAEWEKVQEGQAKQIFYLTNAIRSKHGLSSLKWDETTAEVAYLHSKDMFQNQYFSHTSPTNGELKDRFQAEQIPYQLAGENIAANYVDGIAAVEGWLNSEGHRVNLLHEDFTHLGVGVYRDYFTQNFMTPW